MCFHIAERTGYDPDNETQQMPAMKPDDPSKATMQDVDSTTLLSKSDLILTFSYICTSNLCMVQKALKETGKTAVMKQK